MTVLFGHQVIIALDEQDAVLEHFLVNEFDASQNSFALLFTHSI